MSLVFGAQYGLTATPSGRNQMPTLMQTFNPGALRHRVVTDSPVFKRGTGAATEKEGSETVSNLLSDGQRNTPVIGIPLRSI